MRVLVVGSGAREHALVRSLAADPALTALACAPGNAGTAALAEQVGRDVATPAAAAALAREWRADLVVVGPELPLIAGTADAVRAAGIACFGPSAAAARIEGSKAFAKDVMAAAGVPTARTVAVDTPARLDAAFAAFAAFAAPYVVKDDGLAAGKGVVVTADVEVARAHALAVLDAGRPVLLESYLDGPEVSLFCLVDGSTVVPLLPAQDFKRVGYGDTGPNTGGMGAYAPLPWADPGLVEDVVARIVTPVVSEMDGRGCPYSGVLYAGLALTGDGPQVIEFNCRFGDPETQVVLALLRTPLAGLLAAAATGRLAAHPPPEWAPGAAVAVVLAAEGYPGTPRTGDPISGADAEGVLHAGTRRRDDGVVVSAGGRVLTVMGTGTDLATAREQAYRRLAGVHLAGSHARTDIALLAASGEAAEAVRPAGARQIAAGGLGHPDVRDTLATRPRSRPPSGPARARLVGVRSLGSRLPVAARAAVPPFHVMDVWAAAGARARSHGDLVNLSAGQPSTPAPAPVRAAAAAALAGEVLGYTETLGIPPLRAALAARTAARYGIDCAPADVVLTTGSSGGFLLAFLAAFDAGDRVALARPGYPCYRNILRALGCEVVELACGPATRFQPTVAMLEGLDEPVAGLVVASPANPTGTMLAPEELAALASWCQAHGVQLVSDEIYHGITYGDAPAPHSAWETSREAVVVASFSKYFSMTGWRLGWLLVPERLRRAVDVLAGNFTICPPALPQHAALAAFEAASLAEVDGHVARYAVNRALLLDGLRRLGIDRLAPADGAFYVYADVGHLTDDTMAFCARMLAETGVATAPGVDFDTVDGPRFLRLSFAGTTADVVEALHRLERWLPARG